MLIFVKIVLFIIWLFVMTYFSRFTNSPAFLHWFIGLALLGKIINYQPAEVDDNNNPK